MGGVGNTLESVGSVTTKIGMIFGSLFTIIFLIITIFIAKKIELSPYKIVKAKIKTAECKKTTKNVCKTKSKTKTCEDEDIYKCKLEIIYKVKSKEYTQTLNVTNKTEFKENESYRIEYNKNKPDVIRKPVNLKPLMYLFMIFTVFAFLGTLLKYTLSKSATGRKINGALTGINALSRLTK